MTLRQIHHAFKDLVGPVLLCLSLKSLAVPIDKPPAYVICYHSKSEMALARECADKEERLTKCGYSAQRISNPTADELQKVAKQSPKGSAPIVLTIGHGMCKCDGADHQTASPRSPNKVIETRLIKKAFTDVNSQTTLLAGQCSSGGLCNDCRCDGHSVGSVTGDSAAALSWTNASDDFSYSRTPVVDEFLDLACDPTLFRKYSDAHCTMGPKGFEKYYRDTISYLEREYHFFVPLNKNKTRDLPGGKGQSVWQVPVADAEKELNRRIRELTGKIKASRKYNALPGSKLKTRIELNFFTYCNERVDATWGDTKYLLRAGLSSFGWFTDSKQAEERLKVVTPANSGCRLVEDPTDARVTMQVREAFEESGQPAFLTNAATATSDASGKWAEKSFDILYLGKPLPAEASKEEKPTDKAISQLDSREKKLLPEKVLQKLPKAIMRPDYSLMKFRHPFCKENESDRADASADGPLRRSIPENSAKPDHGQL